MLSLHLLPDREKSLFRRHPWLFSGAVARQEGDPGDGLCEVLDARGRLLGRGFCSPGASLVARVLSFRPDEPLDEAFFAGRIRAALALRAAMVPRGCTGYRALNAEGDGLPGIVADRYEDVLVVQIGTTGADRARPLWMPALIEATKPRVVLVRNELPLRAQEGLGLQDELLLGELPDAAVPFKESGLSLLAEVRGGQKTGYFLDQRDNRLRFGRLVRERNVLDLCCFGGGFGLAALRGGARRVVEVDASAKALDLARRHRVLNALPASDEDFVRADLFDDLRARVDAGERWDAVVLDPPPFAKKREDLGRALRGYRDVNRLSMKLLAPGGLLLSCSCSGLVDALLFQKTLFGAAVEAGVELRLLGRWGAGPDHPVSLFCPEGEYLKVFLLEARA